MCGMREHTWQDGSRWARMNDQGHREVNATLPELTDEVLRLAERGANLTNLLVALGERVRELEASASHERRRIAEAMGSKIAALEAEVERLRGEAEIREDCNRQLVGRVEFLECLVKLDLVGYVVWHRHDGDMVKLIPIPVEREAAIDNMEVAEGPPIEISLYP
jgi:hypothetical protein